MAELVQCVPNISEGCRADVIAAVLKAVESTPGVHLLDHSSDSDHNRTVITFVGPLEPVKQAALNLVRTAVSKIDMNEHQGGHPRIGAVDVLPLIPIQDISMETCAAAAAELAETIWNELQVPAYLYGEAAQVPARKNLAHIRRGQYEGLKKFIGEPERKPDFGEARLHPTAGAIVVGARMPLIAFNVYLNSTNTDIAKAAARAVRQSSGGLQNVKAMAVTLADRSQVQVSMNVENYVQTPLPRILELIKIEAARFGAAVAGSEIVGLVPQQALIDSAIWYLQLEGFSAQQVLENRLPREG